LLDLQICFSVRRDDNQHPERLSTPEFDSPIQVTGLHVSQTLWLTTGEKHTIGRDKVVVLQPDQIPNLDTSPCLGLESRGSGIENLCTVRV